MAVENLITEHIDIWTSAVKTKSTSGRGSSNKLELYGVKKLRELILELAVRGKLVPQDPNDEPASVLLERIAQEKAQLVKEKKIKKPRKYEPIDDNSLPFNIPSSWKWARIEDLGRDLGQKKPDKTFTYVDVGSINKELGYIDEPSILEHSEAPSRARKLVQKNTVIYSTVRPYLLNIAVIDRDFNPEPIASTAFAIIHPLSGISSSYIYRYLRSPSFIEYVESVQTGIAYPAINDKQFFFGLIPVPPSAEQRRIVAKVDELMALCDQLEQQTEDSIEAHQVLVTTLLDTLTSSANADELMQNWARISEHFDTLFTTEESIDQLKQTILQLAVMGKLVPQDPTDEPASELLKRIAEEKAQLVKDKKIKKQKALPPIAEDEKPFELPSGWVWERIDNLSNLIEYGSSQKTVDPFPGGVPVLKMGDIQNGQLILGDHKMMSADVEELPSLYLKNNDILYNRTNSAELVGKTGIFKGEDDKYSFASYLIRIRCNSRNVLPDYINLSMNTPLFRTTQVEPHIKKQCGQANVNGTLMKSMLVSIPPLNEQKQIVSKVNQLISACNSLRRTIEKSKLKQLNIANSIVKRLV
ncbi:restriction endonuclease subunit S [Vibrio parahaemolyticus]|uniref:Type I restriction modification DNA specificity domain-containing protein n=2 Tax=Vibrio harveyi group TaxID=717610 RepID=A0A0C3HMA0_9VIBR|nr:MULTISPECIES: restriction endonuclease subunit S [Vibrio harveyi group]EKO3576996.1 restriction endonuclease subunit S [Vibrio metschnikovii]EGQ8551401.1 restriction endonuclease subunit S [Vibrio parahaemolyticus]EGQ9075031.1 restriction endonuclease subunit S [Vibrio parahaemolyticus]EGQ9132880.1 restriction endonuclease subunit S [Vibrio parahaemolyticus]EIO3215165.1 restriction endonuclease subunit S [Vibrio parahaemolyticus]